MKPPSIDAEELQKLKELKKRNFEVRLRFIDQYVEWLKKNKVRKVKR